jgi:hypothetical protein
MERRWDDNIKIDFQEVGVGRGDWMELAQDRDGNCRQPQTYVKPEAVITVFELLMMSGMSLETC